MANTPGGVPIQDPRGHATPTERLVVVGRRMDGTKTYHGYLPVSTLKTGFPPGSDLGVRYYAKALHPSAGIGQTIEITRTDDGRSVYTSGEHAPRVVDPVDVPPKETPSRDQIAAWQAADRAAYVIAETIRTDRRLAREAPDPLHAALDVVRDAYRAQRGIASRAAFVRYVEEYIHS